MTTTEAFLEGDDRNFTINFGPQHPAARGVLRLLVVVSALVVTSCATPSEPKQSPSRAGVDLEKSATISKVADMFAGVPSGDVRDCMHYAMFKGLAGDNLLNLSDTSKKQASRDVKAVWRRVFNNKSESERKEAIDNSQLRVKARQSGELEKLSEEKCLVPVYNKLTEVKSGYWVEK